MNTTCTKMVEKCYRGMLVGMVMRKKGMALKEGSTMQSVTPLVGIISPGP